MNKPPIPLNLAIGKVQIADGSWFVQINTNTADGAHQSIVTLPPGAARAIAHKLLEVAEDAANSITGLPKPAANPTQLLS